MVVATEAPQFPCSPAHFGMADQGDVDMVFVFFSVAMGGLCALLRYRASMMLALSASLALGTVLVGTAFHVHPLWIISDTFGSVVAFQFTYVGVSLAYHLVHSRRLIPEVQAAIGKQLGADLEAPRGLPPELSALVAQLPTSATVFGISRDRDFMN